VFVLNRGGAIVDRQFGAVLADEHSVVRQADDDAIALRSGRRVLNRFSRLFIHNAKNGVQRLPQRVVELPARHRLSHGIQVSDGAIRARRDHGVSHAFESDAQQFGLLAGSMLPAPHYFTDDDDDQRGCEIEQRAGGLPGRREAELKSWLDEKIVAHQVAHGHDQKGRTRATQPNGEGNGSKQGHKRQMFEKQWIKEPTNQHRDR
jgi:hypothetical protein